MINKHLMASVRREKRVSLQALYQSFDRIRKAYGNLISREEAAYVYASRLGIDVYKFLKNEPEFRDRVANLISKSQVVTTAKANPSKRNKTSAVQKILKIRETSLHDPQLPNRILDDAKEMAEVYPIICF